MPVAFPTSEEDRQALDWIADNPGDPRTVKTAEILGVTREDAQAWKWSKDNPNDKRATTARNIIFDKIAEARPANMSEQGGDIKSRVVAKNLLDNDPLAQKAYYEKKGYKTRVSIDGDLQVKSPGESYFKAVDPKGIDKWDAADIISDIIGGAVSVPANAVKLAGPVGFAAGSLVSGAAAAGLEAGKQVLANAFDVRDGYNEALVAKEGMIGLAVPSVLHVGGWLAKGVGKGIQKGLSAIGIKAKPNASEIEAATKAIGGEATPGQLVDSRLVQRNEMTQWEIPGRLGGMSLRANIQKNIDAAKNTAKEIVGAITASEPYQLGKEFGESLSNSVAEKIAPAKAIYRKWEQKFLDTPIDKQPLMFSISELADTFKMDHAVTGKLQQFYNTAEKATNLQNIKDLRTSIFGELKETNNPEVKRALGLLYNKVSDIRSQMILDMAEKESPQLGALAAREIGVADKLYGETMRAIENVIGQNIKGSPKKRIEEFLKTPAVERMKAILNTNDVDMIKKFQQDFPASFEFIRDQKVLEIAERSKNPQGIIDPKMLIEKIKNIPNGTKAILFGDDAPDKIKALRTYLESLPNYKDHPNPSKTSFNEVFLSLAKGGMDQLVSFKRSAMYNVLGGGALGKDMFTTLGQTAQQPLTKGITYGAAKTGVLNPLLPRPLEQEQ